VKQSREVNEAAIAALGGPKGIKRPWNEGDSARDQVIPTSTARVCCFFRDPYNFFPAVSAKSAHQYS
jgi:hypothetical protein